MLEHVQRGIFSVHALGSDGHIERGTAFGVSPDHLVTCAHVMAGVSKVTIGSGEPIFDGKKGATAEVVRKDERLDLALLKIAIPSVHFLELSPSEKVDDATPLLVWTWPGWNTFEEGKVGGRGLEIHCVPRAAVATDWWPGEGEMASRFTIAGHVKEGMSGGPVTLALTGAVVGVITDAPDLDPSEIVENWRGNQRGSANAQPRGKRITAAE